MSVRPAESSPSKTAQVLDGNMTFDLTRPPSRADVGMPDGRPYVAYQRDDHRPFAVRVALPSGKMLDVRADVIAFAVDRSAGSATGAPTSLDLHSYVDSLEAGRDQLLATAAQFGLDRRPIEAWYDQTRAPHTGSALPPRTNWLSTQVGYLTLSVEGRYDWAHDGGSDQTVVHYLLSWS